MSISQLRGAVGICSFYLQRQNCQEKICLKKNLFGKIIMGRTTKFFTSPVGGAAAPPHFGSFVGCGFD
jgi:hypothetical protein